MERDMIHYNSYYISLLLVFSFIAYFVATDDSAAKLIILLTKICKINIERIIWMLKYNPNNPINKYLIWRRALKLAKEMQKELSNK